MDGQRWREEGEEGEKLKHERRLNARGQGPGSAESECTGEETTERQIICQAIFINGTTPHSLMI
jgi:hypothetical protein